MQRPDPAAASSRPRPGRACRIRTAAGHHDDGTREFAYDRDFRLSPLAEALDKVADYGVTLVSMKRDWKSVFPAGRPTP